METVQWPRPCDVVVEKYYNVNYMLDDLKKLMCSTEPETLTERRLRRLTTSEHLLPYRGFGMWHKEEIIRKLEEKVENITTFDANEYIEKLKALL